MMQSILCYFGVHNWLDWQKAQPTSASKRYWIYRTCEHCQSGEWDTNE